MEPELKKDDIIIIKKCKEEELKVGDIVTFKRDGEVITHRIVEIDKNDNTGIQYLTKGDNNNVADDEYITFEDIEGLEILRIPYLGKKVNALKSGIIIILILLIFLIVYLNKIEMKEKSEIRREKKKLEDKKFLDKQ